MLTNAGDDLGHTFSRNLKKKGEGDLTIIVY
jgi:hypothetical protein